MNLVWKKTGIELTNELPGFVPSTSYYDRYYGKNRWRALTIISLAIGQGDRHYSASDG